MAYSKQDMIERINSELDLPFVPEGVEEVAIRWVIERIWPAIPDWLLPVLYDSLDGLDASELGTLEDTLVGIALERVDLPYIPKSFEEQLIRPVIKAIFEYAAKGKTLAS